MAKFNEDKNLFGRVMALGIIVFALCKFWCLNQCPVPSAETSGCCPTSKH